jgi:hypothetical protein
VQKIVARKIVARKIVAYGKLSPFYNIVAIIKITKRSKDPTPTPHQRQKDAKMDAKTKKNKPNLT